LDLEAGSYSILVKITAQRIDDFATEDELIRTYRKTRREKLLQVGANNDATHSKGRLRELEVANVERARAKAKQKSRAEMVRAREAQRKDRMLDKLRIKEEEKRKRAEARKAKRAARPEKTEKNVVSNSTMTSPGEEGWSEVHQAPREQTVTGNDRLPATSVYSAPTADLNDASAETGTKSTSSGEKKQGSPTPPETSTPAVDTSITSSLSELIKTPSASSSDPDAPRPHPSGALLETTAGSSQASPPEADTKIVEVKDDTNAPPQFEPSTTPTPATTKTSKPEQNQHPPPTAATTRLPTPSRATESKTPLSLRTV